MYVGFGMNTTEWHVRPRNPANPVVFFGEAQLLEEIVCVSCNLFVFTVFSAADVTIGGTPAGRVTMELFADVVPKTAENVRQLFTGEYRYNTLKFAHFSAHTGVTSMLCTAPWTQKGLID